MELRPWRSRSTIMRIHLTSSVRRVLALAALAALALAACAPVSGGPATPTPAPPKPAPTAAPAPAVATTAPAKPAASQPPAGKTESTAALEDFYQGKTVRVIVATTAGSAFDAWARLIARQMPKYIPGNPTMIVENMPGAGHLIGANYLYNVAPKDGTVIGTFVETQATNQLTGGKGIEFDMAKFNWLGAVSSSNIACLARTDIGNKVTDLSEMLGPNGKEIVFGTTGPGTNGYDFPFLMKQLLGANIKLVSGYPGNQEVRLAIENAEIEAYCATWDGVRRGLESWKEAGRPPFRVLVQEGDERHRDIPDVPLMRELAKTEDDKLMFRILSGPSNYTRPFAAPPGIPPERAEALRQAFLATFKDPDLIQEAQRSDLDFDPRSGAQVEAGMKEILAAPQAAVERFTKLMTR